MPSLLTDLRLRATIERDSYELFSETFSGNEAVVSSASRSTSFYTAITISGWGGGGTVTITGLLSGITVTTALVFTSNERRVAMSQKFDTLLSVTTSGFAAGIPSLLGDLLGFTLGGSGVSTGIVRVDAVSRTGQPMEELETFATGVYCKVTRERFGSLQQSVGEASMDAARIFFFPGQDLKRQDIVVADGDRWRIKGVQDMFRLSDGMPYYKVAIVHSEEQS